MPNVPTGKIPYLAQPTGWETFGLVAGGVLAVVQLAKGQAESHAQRIQAAHDIGAAVFSATPLGPWIKLEGEVVGAVGGIYEASLMKKKLKRIKRNLAHAYRHATNAGQGELYAARYALSRVGVNPETVIPLAPPIMVAPGATVTVPATRPHWRTGKVRPGYSYDLAPQYVTDPVAASSPFYDPDVRAAVPEQSIAIKYGSGPAADAVRDAYGDALTRELASRPFPGQGIVPLPFATLRN